MKKTILIAALALVGMTATAQIVTSNSTIVTKTEEPKKPSNTRWFVKAGLAFDNLYGDDADDIDSKTGYDFRMGFIKPMGDIGAYWGMDWGIMSRGYNYDEPFRVNHGSYYSYEDITAQQRMMAIQFTPFTFGWLIPVGDIIEIDPHIGLYFSYDVTGSFDYDTDYSISNIRDWDDDMNMFDVGFNIGVGAWFLKRFNFDISVRTGLMKMFDYSDAPEAYQQKIELSLGVAF